MAFTGQTTVPQDTVETSEFGPQFPLIQYGYGDQKLARVGGFAYTGGFFIPFDRLGPEDSEERTEYVEALQKAGWNDDEFTTNDGEVVRGLYRRDIEVSIVHRRFRWEAGHGERAEAFYPARGGYQEAQEAGYSSVKGRLQLLVVLRGLEHVEDPFIITFGPMAQMKFSGTKSLPGILPRFERTLIAKANDMAKSRFPWRAFYLRMGAESDDKGKPVFFKTNRGDNHLVLPEYLVDAQTMGGVTQAMLDEYYVGDDLLSGKLQAMYETHREWAEAWNTATTVEDDAAPTEQQQAESGDAVVAEPGL